MKYVCKVIGFIETYLDPAILAMNLADTLLYGKEHLPIMVEGHIYDDPTYKIVGDKEYEYRLCIRCKSNIEQGWRWGGIH